MERTETEKVLQTPIKVGLGVKEFEIKPLPVKYALPWCGKVVGLLKDIPAYAEKIDKNDLASLGDVLQCLMAGNPALIVDLFFEYARDIDRSEIEEVATSAEIVAGFEGVLSLELPLLGSVGRTIKAISQ